MDKIITLLNSYVWSWPLVGLCLLAALYFSFGTRFVQVRHIGDMVRLLFKKDRNKKEGISSFQAFALALSGRVGTGNIVGVAMAIGMGGPGAIVWMWIIAFFGAGTAYAEACLAQIYKTRQGNQLRGGPAYYIEKALHAHWLAMVFCVCLIATYAVGFNLLCSYNLQSTFAVYSFYDPKTTPVIVGLVLAVLTGYCLLGGGKRIIRLTSVIVPFMGVFYIIISLIVILVHIRYVPAMFVEIFSDAFDFRAIFGGISGSCLVYGIKRGLYSNEAGVGSAPNASASADVTHPVKQGLVQTLSVYIDTLLLCTATALMCLASGVPHTWDVSGAVYVQNAISSVFGKAGPVFITAAMLLFAFTTLLGNLYYVDNALIFLNGKKEPSRQFQTGCKTICAAIIFVGAIIPMDAAWAMADITMGCMTLINLPACMALGNVAVRALKDYEKQKREGKNPSFRAEEIGLNAEELDYWK